MRWNDVVDAVKPVAQTLVREKTRDMIEAHNLPAVFIGTVDWDILHLRMEAEYADVYLPGLYACQAYWYVKGHVPCEYRGEFPGALGGVLKWATRAVLAVKNCVLLTASVQAAAFTLITIAVMSSS